VSEGETVGLLGFMPDLYFKSKTGSLLSKAVLAVAYANYAQRFRAAGARKPAIASCTAALELLQAEMKSPADGRVDETLLSIILLGLYEVCVHKNSDILCANLKSYHSYSLIV
jgi:transcription factor-like protein